MFKFLFVYRYLDINWHAKNYTWKSLKPISNVPEYEFLELDMDTFVYLNLPYNFYIPVINLYWNDDLYIA